MNTNIKLDKLKQEKEKTEHFVKINSVEYKEHIKKMKADRQAAKEAIIRKLNQEEMLKKPNPKIKIRPNNSQSLRDQIKVIDDENKHVVKKKITNQEKLSYTLQIDKTSISEQMALRNKPQKNSITITDKLTGLNQLFNRIYLGTTLGLAFLCLVVFSILFFTSKQ